MKKTRPVRSGPVCNQHAMQSIEIQNPLKRGRRDVAASARGRGSRAAACMSVLAGIVWLALLVPGALADNPPPSGGEFVIRNSSIDSGSGGGAGGDIAVTGTIGQPDAGVTTGENFTVRGGFRTFKAPSDRVFRNGFE